MHTKQRKHLSNKFTAIFAASVLSFALTGVTCGSFAWFAYESRAGITSLEGITIGVGNLEVGFVSEVELFDSRLNKDTTSSTDYDIYWLEGHTLDNDLISYFLEMNGYATDRLIPTSSYKYPCDDAFNLYSSPRINDNNIQVADKNNYIFLPLVFRYADVLEENTYISNENIYMTKAEPHQLNHGSHIHEALRIFTDNRNDNQHLINPSTDFDGETEVGGLLDLNGDGYYDFEQSENEYFEHIYGQTTNISPTGAISGEPAYNGSSFVAGHLDGVHSWNFDPEKASFEGFRGFRSKGKCVTTTNPSINNLAFLNLSIYIEGWDLAVVDSEIEIPFSLGLQFEVKI